VLFNTALFAFYFLGFYAVYQCAPGLGRAKQWTITLGSLVFYAAWDVRFVPLLVGTALLDFFIARAIDGPGVTEAARRRLLAGSIVMNLGVLAFFKYAGFLVSSAFGLLHLAGIQCSAPLLHIVLPVGISFYTFQSMSYTIDVYRREIRAREHPIDFLAAVTFFPHLVAGPIIRATTLLPQFERPRAASWLNVRRGCLLVATGLAKKTLADLLGDKADLLFAAPAQAHGALASWTGALAFAGQIYGDFSGYTDIAIGVALLLGFSLPPNFDYPYLARSPIDFWRRWHISLSTWLRNYLYLPLGGSRSRRYRNLMVTMLLGGLWHGASWTFVAWGLYHGCLLVAAHALRARGVPIDEPPRSALSSFGSRALTFYLVVVGWVLFRSTSFGQAWRVIADMHGAGGADHDAHMVWTLGMVLIGLVAGHAVTRLGDQDGPLLPRPWLGWCAVVFLIGASMAFGQRGRPFIYFQF
jgi:alginate O-acetyltransferase complex protein AlgI